MRIRLLHKLWELVFVSPGVLREKKRRKRRNGRSYGPSPAMEEVIRGDCDDPDAKNKQIRIANNLPMQEEMEVVIHECLHACDWWKDEEWIKQVGEDISHLMVKRLGWVKLGSLEAEKILKKHGWKREEDEE